MGIKKGSILFLVIIVIAALVLTFVNNQSTGMATLTPDANYAPIDKNGFRYSSCIYLSVNEGWDVTKKGEVKYFDRLKGSEHVSEDECMTYTKVKEFDCADGFMVERAVICPSKMICRKGVCT